MADDDHRSRGQSRDQPPSRQLDSDTALAPGRWATAIRRYRLAAPTRSRRDGDEARPGSALRFSRSRGLAVWGRWAGRQVKRRARLPG
uniref:Uncharacterized protein n=1 Tax=Oryza meridionalis TaxID=40149 RepID=A0A0E0F1Z4_9ORYZ